MRTGSLVAASCFSLLVGCGGAHTASPATPGAAPLPAPTAGTPAPSVDVTEVPLPPQWLAVLRVASLRSIVDRFDRMLGPHIHPGRAMDGIRQEVLGAMAPALDPEGPVDAMAVLGPGGLEAGGGAIAFNVASVAALQHQLGSNYRFVPIGNGVLRLDPVPEQRDGAMARHCNAAPSPDPQVVRVICATDPTALDAATPYLARTLPRHAVAPDEISLHLASGRLLDAAGMNPGNPDGGSHDPAAPFTDARIDPAVRTAATAFLRELYSAAGSISPVPSTADARLALADDRVHLQVSTDVPTPLHPWVQALYDALSHPDAVSPAMRRHLLPNGSVSAALAYDSRPLHPFVSALAEIGAQMLAHDHTLDRADQEALRAAVATLDHPDARTAAFALGADAHGHLWGTATVHAATMTPAAEIADLRAVLSAWQRPHIVSALEPLLGGPAPTRGHRAPPPVLPRELPSRTLPAGSYVVELPPLEPLLAPFVDPIPAPPPTGHAPPPQVRLQLALVPQDGDLAVLLGTDPDALYRAYAANTAPGDDPTTDAPRGYAMAATIIPASLLPVLLTDPLQRTQIVTAMAGFADHGATPVRIRLAASQTEGMVHATCEITTTAQTMRNLAELTSLPPPVTDAERPLSPDSTTRRPTGHPHGHPAH